MRELTKQQEQALIAAYREDFGKDSLVEHSVQYRCGFIAALDYVASDLDDLKRTLSRQNEVISQYQAETAALDAVCDDLRAVLQPLAALWRDAYEDKPDGTPVYGLNDVVLRVGDIRAARQALEK